MVTHFHHHNSLIKLCYNSLSGKKISVPGVFFLKSTYNRRQLINSTWLRLMLSALHQRDLIMTDPCTVIIHHQLQPLSCRKSVDLGVSCKYIHGIKFNIFLKTNTLKPTTRQNWKFFSVMIFYNRIDRSRKRKKCLKSRLLVIIIRMSVICLSIRPHFHNLTQKTSWVD